MSRKTKSQKIGPRGVFIEKEKESVPCEYIEEMADCVPLTLIQVKLKVRQITQEKIIPFKNKILEKTCMMW